MKADEARAVRPDAPLLVVRSLWAGDIRSWAWVGASVLALGALTAATAGVGAYFLSQPLGAPRPVAGMAGLAVWVSAWYLWARPLFRRRQGEQRFHDDRVVAQVPVRGGLRSRVVPYRSIGAVDLVGGTTVAVRFGIPRCRRRNLFTMTLPRVSAQDHVDQLVQWIEAAAPDHLFTWDDHRARHGSRPWELAEVFPGHRQVSGLATATGGRRPTLTVGDRIFRCHRHGPEVHLVGAGALAMAAVYSEDRRGARVRVFAEPGFEVAACDLAAGETRIRLRFGCGIEVAWDLDSGAARLIRGDGDDRVVAEVAGAAAGGRVRLLQPAPEPVVLALLLLGILLPSLWTPWNVDSSRSD